MWRGRGAAATEGSGDLRWTRNVLREPRGVLALVVLAILAGLDRLPPVAAGAVPVDRLRQAGLAERVPRRPSDRAQLGVVERVAAVVTGAVLDVADQARVGARQLDDPVRDLDVLELLAADVVDLARLALAEDQLDGRTMVVCVEPLAHLLAVPVDRQGE